MNLIADIGNSSTKLALYENNVRISISRVEELNVEETEKIISGFRISRAIISSVRSIPYDVLESLSGRLPYVHLLSNKSKLPFHIAYETPETLGPDRIAGVAGAHKLFPGADILVIDAGTAITFDFISKNIYKGGNISPGISTRLRALHEFTGRLPLIRASVDFTDPGINTRDAILAGVMKGVLYEINEYIRTFEKNSTDPKIILTGGDGELLKDRLNSQLFHQPEIVMDGLNYILEYNAS